MTSKSNWRDFVVSAALGITPAVISTVFVLNLSTPAFGWEHWIDKYHTSGIMIPCPKNPEAQKPLRDDANTSEEEDIVTASEGYAASAGKKLLVPLITASAVDKDTVSTENDTPTNQSIASTTEKHARMPTPKNWGFPSTFTENFERRKNAKSVESSFNVSTSTTTTKREKSEACSVEHAILGSGCSRMTLSSSTQPLDTSGAPQYTPYDRHEWMRGGKWADTDKDCQNTRQEVLIEESLIQPTLDARGCKVISGLWFCPYTGKVFRDPKKLDVDHMVPLGEAHASGGAGWTMERKLEYANDIDHADHLVTVSASANRQKGKKRPDQWMPETKKCWYIKAWVMVKARNGLTFADAERRAIRDQLRDCPLR